jgi:hypothetical protein
MGSAGVHGQLWGKAAHDWAELQEPTSAPLWEAMLDAAAVGPGTRVLDAGCGAGGASILAASRGARVNGLDDKAGLRRIGGGIVRCPSEYLDPDTAWQAQASAGPLQSALRAVGRGPLKEAVQHALAPFGTSTGGVWLRDTFQYVTTVPHDP